MLKRSTSKMCWLRQGGAVLVGFVAVGVWLQAPTRTEDYTAKNEAPLVGERIDVMDATPYKYGPFAVPNLRNYTDVGEQKRSYDNKFPIGRDDRLDGGESRLLIKFRWPSVAMSNDWRVTPNLDIISWGLAGISEVDFYVNPLALKYGFAINIGDIGAELPLAGVSHDVYGLTQAARLNDESDQLQYTDEANSNSRPEHPPISRIFFIALAGVVGGTLALWFGPNYLDNRRRALGSALIGGGFLLVALAFGLCLTIGLRGTWGWLL